MGQQINFYHTTKDDLELIESIKTKMDIYSLPRSFKKEDFMPKPLGNYVNLSEDVFSSSCLDSLSSHIIKSPDSDDYFLHTKENFYLEWIKTRFDICTEKPTVDFVAWDGRFYMEASYPGSKEEPSSELKKLYALVCREIKKSSPYLIPAKKKFFIGKDMAAQVFAGKIFIHYQFIKNPLYKGEYI